jgi:hypothetical protein
LHWFLQALQPFQLSERLWSTGEWMDTGIGVSFSSLRKKSFFFHHESIVFGYHHFSFSTGISAL